MRDLFFGILRMLGVMIAGTAFFVLNHLLIGVCEPNLQTNLIYSFGMDSPVVQGLKLFGHFWALIGMTFGFMATVVGFGLLIGGLFGEPIPLFRTKYVNVVRRN